jgi:hypothetical protein
MFFGPRKMQAISDLSLTGQDSLLQHFDLGLAIPIAKSNPAVKERRRQLRAEKKRPKGQIPEGPDPDFF